MGCVIMILIVIMIGVVSVFKMLPWWLILLCIIGFIIMGSNK